MPFSQHYTILFLREHPEWAERAAAFFAPQSEFPYFCSFFTPLGSAKHGNGTDSTRNGVRGKCILNRGTIPT